SAATPISAGTAPFTGAFRPESPLSVLNGTVPNGTWQLQVTDTATFDTGTLLSWSVVTTTLGAPYVCNLCSATPAEVPLLVFGDRQSLGWGSVPTATSYTVYRGVDLDLPSLLTSALDSCARDTTPGTSVADLTETPAPGAFLWWIVRAANANGEGPAG